jgi:hypothetical protein
MLATLSDRITKAKVRSAFRRWEYPFGDRIPYGPKLGTRIFCFYVTLELLPLPAEGILDKD